ncbi:MAG TPA: serine/threonine-protein kinase, partial [Pseudomonadota bacterium]|nr:serine/threonine-protein kinase [Pseudomonadota bacterium]
RKLGEGGMGAVYAALNEAIERQVAIKVLHPEFAKVPEFTTRFFNEARAVNRIDHPGVVQIGDFGQLPDGTAYIVMEFLKGESMADKLEKASGPLLLTAALNYGAQLAETLSIAHSKGIIHRDIKPDNVMIVRDHNAPGGERTKLLDFGIAKLTSEATAAGVKTRTSAVMGTPHFMSPEQCKGGKNVDEKSDVYALGILLFVMLTGRYPFDGDGVGDIMGKHMFEPPPTVKSVVPEVPDVISQLVGRLLAKSKDDRPSMDEVQRTLDGLRKNVPAADLARPAAPSLGGGPDRPSTAGIPIVPPSSSARRGRLALGAAAGLLLAGTAAAAVFLLRSPHGGPAGGESGATATPQLIHWRIESAPAGAEVVQVSDGAVLGKTPWEKTRPAALGRVGVKLRLAGYAEREVSLDLSADSMRSEIMVATGAPPSAVPPRPADAPVAPGSKSGKKGSRDKRPAGPIPEPGGRRFGDE